MKPIAALLALALLTPLAACKYEPGQAEVDPLSVEAYPQITVSGSMVGQTFLSEPPIVTQTDQKPLQVTVPLRLKQEEELSVQYRFLFRNAAGVPLDLDPGWKYTVIRGREKTWMQGTAKDTSAKDWQLEVRESK